MTRLTLMTASYAASDTADAVRAATADDGLAGCWTAETGRLNTVVTLWRGLPPLQDPHPMERHVHYLDVVVGPKPPASEGGFYELRHYRLRPGMTDAWVGIYTAALPSREKYSPIVALFRGKDEVVHIWNYPDLNARTKARAAALQDPDWQAFLKESRGQKMTVRQDVTIMLPARGSPLR